MNPYELSTTVTALANIIAQNLSDNELNLASVIFSEIGCILGTISISRSQASGTRQQLFDK